MRSALVLLLIICVYSTAVFAESQDSESVGDMAKAFANWVKRFRKSFSSSKFMSKLKAFTANMKFINKANENAAKKGLKFKMGANILSDLTPAEYARMLNPRAASFLETGLGADAGAEVEEATEASLDAMESLGVEADVENGGISWVSKMAPVKMQGSCGSCWAFATTAAVEFVAGAKAGSVPILSEQALVDCSMDAAYKSVDFGYGCNGGKIPTTLNFIKKNKGLPTAAAYGAYTASVGACKKAVFEGNNNQGAIKNVKMCNSINAIDKALKKGPVVVAMYFSDLQHFASGVWSGQCTSSKPNHGIVIVGEGVADGTPYYLVRNSYSENWGEAGYIRMAKTTAQGCGVTTSAYLAQ